MDHTIDHPLHSRENVRVSFRPETLKKVQQLIARYPAGRQKSALLPVLHIAQEESGGHLSVEVMDYVASLLDLMPIEVYEVATFYSMFYLDKVGKYVMEVCRTGSCDLAGSARILAYLEENLGIRPGETTPDGLFTLKVVECLGSCGTSPVMQVNSEFHENLTVPKVERLIGELRHSGNMEKPGDTKWADQFC